jgi:cytochrome P450
MSDTSKALFRKFLMFAGHETTSGGLGLSMVAMARNPDQHRLVMNDPAFPALRTATPHRPAGGEVRFRR